MVSCKLSLKSILQESWTRDTGMLEVPPVEECKIKRDPKVNWVTNSLCIGGKSLLTNLLYVSLDWPTANDRNRAKLMKNNMVSCRLSRKNHPNECLKRPSHLHLVQPTWSVLKAQEEAPAMRQQLLSSAQQVTFAESQTSMHLRIHITTLTTLYLYYF